MSIETWTTDGFGVSDDALDKVDFDSLMAVLKSEHPDVYEAITEYGDDYESVNDRLFDEYDWKSCRYVNSIEGLVAIVLTSRIGIDFYAYQNEDSDRAVMYPMNYPWNMSDREKSMTKDDIIADVRKVMSDLGADLLDVDVSYIEFHNWG